MLKTLNILFESQKKKNYAEIDSSKDLIILISILQKLNLIYFFQVNGKVIKVFLKKNSIKSIKFISKPSRKIYCNVDQLNKLKKLNKIFLIKTVDGILTSVTAIKNRVGGELLCEILY